MYKRHLIFSGQYTYTNWKDDTGKSLIRRARHLASTNFIYTFYDDRAKIDLGVDYNGEQWDVLFSNYFASQKNILLDDFILVNVAGSYALTDKVTLLGRVVNILDTDVFIFGGGLSNEINFFNEIQSKVRKFVAGNEFEGIFLKPKFGDASGVRGAARLGRNINY